MKKLKLWALALAGIFTMNSCKDDDNVKPTAFLMQINEPSGAFARLEANTALPIEITATSNKGIIAFSATATYDDSTFAMFTNVVDTVVDFIYVDTLIIPNTTSDVIYAFTAMDSDSAKVTRSITVDVINNFTTKEGQLWNAQGANNSAYNFLADSSAATSGDSTMMDIVDNTAAGVGAVYDATWTSANGTTFVIDNNLTFAANISQITAAYDAGTEVETTGTLTAGTIVICKNARFPQGYVLVEVTNVEDTSVLDALDNISFNYKK
jgi:hypothetical protein